jgi:hypothetical protein
MDTVHVTADFIQRIFHNFELTIVEDHLKSAFIHIGFSCNIDDAPYILPFDQDTLIKSEAFREFCELNNLSSCCRRDAEKLDSDGSTKSSSKFWATKFPILIEDFDATKRIRNHENICFSNISRLLYILFLAIVFQRDFQAFFEI